MNKGIWAGLVAIAFVAGSIMTGTMAYAASNAQGQPFQQLQQQIDEIKAQIGIGEDNFTVDSFFDVVYKITMSSDECREGEIPKLNEDLTDTNCSSDFVVDSFFDIFYRIETDTKRNTQNIGEIQTELVALDLRSLPAVCTPGDVAKFNGLTRLWECAVDETGAGVETDPVFGSSVAAGITQPDINRWNSALTTEVDPQVGILVNGQWCRNDGTRINCDVIPLNTANFAKLDDTNTFGPRQRFSSTVDVGLDLNVGNRMDVFGPTDLRSSLAVAGPITSTNSMTSPIVRGTNQVCIGSDCRNAWPSGGSAGTLQVATRIGSATVFNGPAATSVASCLAGEVAVGGGYSATRADTTVFSQNRGTISGLQSWIVDAYNPLGEGSTITAYVYCARILP